MDDDSLGATNKNNFNIKGLERPLGKLEKKCSEYFCKKGTFQKAC